MKTLLSYIFLFGLFFMQPCHSFSLDVKKDSHFIDSFQKTAYQDSSFDIDDTQNNNLFFDDDDLNDDDDISSIKKKMLVFNFFFGAKQWTSIYFYNNFKTKLDVYAHFTHFPLSDFISLRVLKL